MRIWKAALPLFLLFLATSPLYSITVSGPIVTITSEEMKEIGKRFAQHLEKKYGVCQDSQLQKKVDQIAKATGASTWHPVKILNTEEVNAFCLPDDWIYVTKGLVEKASKNELYFVLRHEVSHAINLDPEEKVHNSILLQSKIRELGWDRTQAVLGGILVDLFEGSYSRDKERRADAEAVNGMIENREDPEGAISLLEKLKILRKEKPESLGKYFASHPPEERRIELIRERIEKAKKEGFTLAPPVYAGPPILILVTETSPENQKEKFMEGWTKEAYKALRQENKFEVVGFWEVLPPDKITEGTAIDRSSLFEQAKKKGIKFVVIHRLSDRKVDASAPFFSSKASIKGSCSAQGFLYDVNTGKLITSTKEDWRFEEKSKLTEVTKHYLESSGTFLRDLTNKLLSGHLSKRTSLLPAFGGLFLLNF